MPANGRWDLIRRLKVIEQTQRLQNNYIQPQFWTKHRHRDGIGCNMSTEDPVTVYRGH